MTNKITHSELVKNLVKDGAIIANEMTPNNAHLLHMIMGLSGEVGELLDAVKKHIIYNKELDLENVIEEIGDLEFYLEGFRQGLNITREETVSGNISKLSKRYGEKYSDSAAQIRADKQ